MVGRYSIVTYLLMMMTSWAIVVDVWYLPPMEMRPGENSVEFAERVKHEIAKKGGLVELLWDGNLKRSKVGFLTCNLAMQRQSEDICSR